ncbi:MAG: hypothetical protein NTU44_15810 [Bacteroidetes bacterium]|nr:hypothetical protein [Bacteroidota bacterium]
MTEIRILGLLIKDRIKEAGRTQQVLSAHARIIRSRLGFHELSSDKCSRTGIILLHLTGTPAEWDKLEADLSAIGGIEVKHMSFNK